VVFAVSPAPARCVPSGTSGLAAFKASINARNGSSTQRCRLAWARAGTNIASSGQAAGIGAAVSVSGNIGFVGLVVPHVLRPLVGYSPKRLLGVSFWGGAILLLLADITVQLLSHGGEMKLGVVTALVGGPFFLYLILRTRSYWS